MKQKRRIFVEKQILAFQERLSDFKEFNIILKSIFRDLIEQELTYFIIQTRVKTLYSFAEKFMIRQTGYRNPIEEITDINGVRIIVPTLNDVKKVSKMINENFVINNDLSGPRQAKLGITEFGYSTTQYSAKLSPESKLYSNNSIHKKFYSFKFEIQIPTFLQHAWATIYHDIGYKGEYQLSKRLNREFYRIAAILEDADEDFSRIEKQLKKFESPYSGFMNKAKLIEDLEKLKIIYSYDQENIEIAHKIAKILICKGDWDEAEKLLFKFGDAKSAPVLRDIGNILKNYDKNSEKFKKSKEYLGNAIKIDPTDIDAYASLGGYWKDVDKEKSLFYYKKAFELDPSNPYSLGNYIVFEIQKQGNLEVIHTASNFIEEAIDISNQQIEIGTNLPWAYFNNGLFYLLLGNIDKSLYNFMMGIRASTHDWMILTTLKTLSSLENHLDNNLSKLLLTIGLTMKFNVKINIENLRIENGFKLKGPLIIIAGSTSLFSEEEMIYKENLMKSFKNFTGTIISGGTQQGISGIVGDIQENWSSTIKTVGYLPKEVSENISIDSRYSDIRTSNGLEFSYEEVLHYWSDIIENDIDIQKVKLIGIGGGRISAFEYRLALTLGIKIGIIEESGGESAIILNDPFWKELKQGKKHLLKPLKNNVEDITHFVNKY